MIILEFIIFVVSSGLFCSEKFRHHLWAVVVAGAIATGSSLLFAYDLGQRMMGHPKEPPVITKIVRQTIEKPGVTSLPKMVGKPHTCADQYPEDALRTGEQGVTQLGFKILTDGTVDAIKVITSSGSDRLDQAAIKCVANWHYRPAIKNGDIVEANWKANVTWKLNTAERLQAEAQAKQDEAQKQDSTEKLKPEDQTQAKEQPAEPTHHWYDIGSWFSSDSDKKSPNP